MKLKDVLQVLRMEHGDKLGDEVPFKITTIDGEELWDEDCNDEAIQLYDEIDDLLQQYGDAQVIELTTLDYYDNIEEVYEALENNQIEGTVDDIVDAYYMKRKIYIEIQKVETLYSRASM